MRFKSACRPYLYTWLFLRKQSVDVAIFESDLAGVVLVHGSLVLAHGRERSLGPWFQSWSGASCLSRQRATSHEPPAIKRSQCRLCSPGQVPPEPGSGNRPRPAQGMRVVGIVFEVSSENPVRRTELQRTPEIIQLIAQIRSPSTHVAESQVACASLHDARNSIASCCGIGSIPGKHLEHAFAMWLVLACEAPESSQMSEIRAVEFVELNVRIDAQKMRPFARLLPTLALLGSPQYCALGSGTSDRGKG